MTTAGLHQNLVPVFVMLIMFILGEGFQWREGVGGLLVISGAIIAQSVSYTHLTLPTTYTV